MGRGKRLTEDEFKNIKKLLENGLSVNLVHKVTGRSPGIVTRVRDSETYEYFVAVKAAEEIVANPYYENEPTPQSQNYDEQALVVLRNLTDAINKMVDQWQSMEDKLEEVLETKRPWLFKGNR